MPPIVPYGGSVKTKSTECVGMLDMTSKQSPKCTLLIILPIFAKDIKNFYINKKKPTVDLVGFYLLVKVVKNE